MAGWNSPIPSTECGGDELKSRLSAGNAGMDATLKMPHSFGMYVFRVFIAQYVVYPPNPAYFGYYNLEAQSVAFFIIHRVGRGG